MGRYLLYIFDCHASFSKQCMEELFRYLSEHALVYFIIYIVLLCDCTTTIHTSIYVKKIL